MINPKDQIPEDLLAFLSQNHASSLRWGQPYPVEVEEAIFFEIDEISFRNFELDTDEYFLNHDEPGNDPKLTYDIPGIDLIKQIDAYSPDGVLIWFPLFGEYGSWDCDHGTIVMMPNLSWTEIAKDPARYVNVQWYPDRVNHSFLRPWADARCAQIQPRQSRY
jgi:hypothetical protein